MSGGLHSETMYHVLGREEKLKRGIVQDPTVDLVDVLLYDAIHEHASDIHLQPHENALAVRCRIDGVLYDRHEFDLVQAPLVLSRLKILANLDIAEKRLPQDGRFKVIVDLPGEPQISAWGKSGDVKEHLIDFRVATFPTLYGEKMVIRILDRSLRLLSLDSLGLQKSMLDQLSTVINHPHGLFLVTGPTGCGKTTMLYALISALNTSEKNIVTIEDPIEYELDGITQSQVNNKAGFTFENGLRAILRQDPDIIMVGEIRDKETAHIAIESALTGHLVLSTLHTNDAASAASRLLEMGTEPFLMSATLVGVLAQRLARRLCNSCKQEKPLDKTQQEFIALHGGNVKTSFVPVGCRACNNIGYKGRIGIFELLLIDEPIKELILHKADALALKNNAVKRTMITLLADGIAKLEAGITSLDEVLQLVAEE